jgi:hypothetical protein
MLLATAAICSGCTREPETLERFMPASDLAHSALEAVLADWKAGLPPGPIDRLPVKVQITDNQRKPGQLLEDFEILGEVPGATARCFAVRLKLRDPVAEEKVRYAVFGIDPLWVFRQEDLEMLSHWEHPMPAEEKAGDAPTDDTSRTPEGAEGPERPPVETDQSTDQGSEQLKDDGEAAAEPARPPLAPPCEGGEEVRNRLAPVKDEAAATSPPVTKGGQEMRDRLVECGCRANDGVAPTGRQLRRAYDLIDGAELQLPPFVRGGRGGLELRRDIRYSAITAI